MSHGRGRCPRQGLFGSFRGEPPLRLLSSSTKRQFGDAGFVELSKSRSDHAVVLFFSRSRQRQVEALFFRLGLEQCRSPWRHGRRKRNKNVRGSAYPRRRFELLLKFSHLFAKISPATSPDRASMRPLRPILPPGAAVLTFITMLTRALTFAAWPNFRHEVPYRLDSTFPKGRAFQCFSSSPPHIR